MTITLFGLLSVLGFIVSGFFLWKRAIDEHLPESEAFDMYITASVWALVAGRISTIILRFDRFGWNPLRWLALFSLPGLDGRAALIVAVLMIVLGALKRKWNPWLTLDIYTPSILLWQTALIILFWWQVAVLWCGWFVLLWWIEREYRLWEWYRGRRGFAHPGLVTSVWCLGLGLGFCLIAWLSSGMIFLQAIGITLALLGLILIYIRSGRVFKSDMAALGERMGAIGKAVHKRRPRI